MVFGKRPVLYLCSILVKNTGAIKLGNYVTKLLGNVVTSIKKDCAQLINANEIIEHLSRHGLGQYIEYQPLGNKNSGNPSFPFRIWSRAEVATDTMKVRCLLSHTNSSS